MLCVWTSRTWHLAAIGNRPVCRHSHRIGQLSFVSTATKDLWRSVNAVCFDVDSTLCEEEGIDVLAAHCGAGEAVKEWTTRAMNGGVKFEDALAARLDLIKPSKQAIQSCLEQHPPILSEGIQQLVSTLHAKKIEVFLVSGGFRLMIQPVAQLLQIPSRNIYANTIFFTENGEYQGFDPTELTSRDGGKAQALQVIKKTHGHELIAMIGDGVTDMQARPPANLLIGYGGVVIRPIVQQQADWFVTDFHSLTTELLY